VDRPGHQGRHDLIDQPADPSPPIRGLVDHFDNRSVTGTVTVPSGSRPVRVELFLNKIKVAGTFAALGEPADDEDAHLEKRPFRFALRDVWRFARTSDRFTVRAEGEPLPIAASGQLHLQPDKSGRRTPSRLRQRMSNGYIFDQFGRLRLSKKLDTEWQRNVMGLFAAVRAFAKERFGYDLFLIYGSLLGAVREGGFIGHDIDLDTAFICRATDGPGAAAELRALAFALIDAGYVVESFGTHLHVTDDADTRIDVFHVYFDANDRLCLPFGIAGTTTLTKADWRGVEEIELPGGRGVVPVNKEQFAEHLYGADWQTPKPGFHWPYDRTTRAAEGRLPPAMHEEIYWANFYAHANHAGGSTFFEFVNGRADTPRLVIDIGCGDGRDSIAFGAAGRLVTGLDRSHVAVAYATQHATELGLGERVRFRDADVTDTAQLSATLREVLDSSPDAPALFYLRFFLHSIPEDVQDGLLGVIDAVARPGDVFAAEFRTDQDQARLHVHRRHYRRYQNGPAFGAALDAQHGFELLFEQESTGLSPYGEEDPMLYRVIARRR
jgi:SAM-dependent methyltransferase